MMASSLQLDCLHMLHGPGGSRDSGALFQEEHFAPLTSAMCMGDMVSAHMEVSRLSPVNDACHISLPDFQRSASPLLPMQFSPDHTAQQYLDLQPTEMLHHLPGMESPPVTMHPNLVATFKSILAPMPRAEQRGGEQMMVEGSGIGAPDLIVSANDMLQAQYLLNLDPPSGALIGDAQSAHAADAHSVVSAELEYMARANEYLRHQNACCQADMMMKQICHEQQLASFQEMHHNVLVDHLQASSFGGTPSSQAQPSEMELLARCNMMQEALKLNDIMLSKQLMEAEQQQHNSQASCDFQYVNHCLSEAKFDDKVDKKPSTFCSSSELDLLVCGELIQNTAPNAAPEDEQQQQPPLYVAQFEEHRIVNHQCYEPSPDLSAVHSPPPKQQQQTRQEPPVLQSMQSSSSNSSGGEYSSQEQQAAVIPLDLIQNRRPFRCSHGGCNKTFKNPQTMRMHRKTHSSVGSAGAASNQTHPSLSAICKAGQNKKIPCRCPICKRTFVGLYELRRHFGRKHTQGEKRHACRKCGKRFYIEVDLRDHEKICGEPMECKCGMKFAFKCNLVAHKKAHPECQDHIYSSSEEEKSCASNKITPSVHRSAKVHTTSGFLRPDNAPVTTSVYNLGLEQRASVAFSSSQMAFLNAPRAASSLVSAMDGSRLESSLATGRALVKEEVDTAMPLSTNSMSHFVPDVTCTGFQLPPAVRAMPHRSAA